MTTVTDLHTHVIPAVDDGPEDEAESLDLLGRIAAAGTGICAATPHYQPPVTALEGVRERFDSLRAAAGRKCIPIELHLGAELSIYAGIQSDAENGKLLTLGAGRAVLLEMPLEGTLPPRFREFVFSLSARGYKPVLAHPERSPAFSWDARPVAGLRDSGALVQITSGALFGEFGRQERGFARSLLKAGLVDVIATDAHSIRRTNLDLREAAAEAARWCGEDAAEAMITSTPARLLSGA